MSRSPAFSSAIASDLVFSQVADHHNKRRRRKQKTRRLSVETILSPDGTSGNCGCETKSCAGDYSFGQSLTMKRVPAKGFSSKNFNVAASNKLSEEEKKLVDQWELPSTSKGLTSKQSSHAQVKACNVIKAKFHQPLVPLLSDSSPENELDPGANDGQNAQTKAVSSSALLNNKKIPKESQRQMKEKVQLAIEMWKKRMSKRQPKNSTLNGTFPSPRSDHFCNQSQRYFGRTMGRIKVSPRSNENKQVAEKKSSEIDMSIDREDDNALLPREFVSDLISDSSNSENEKSKKGSKEKLRTSSTEGSQTKINHKTSRKQSSSKTKVENRERTKRSSNQGMKSPDSARPKSKIPRLLLEKTRSKLSAKSSQTSTDSESTSQPLDIIESESKMAICTNRSSSDMDDEEGLPEVEDGMEAEEEEISDMEKEEEKLAVNFVLEALSAGHITPPQTPILVQLLVQMELKGIDPSMRIDIVKQRQRQEIYALNRFMTDFEFEQFENFCIENSIPLSI